jgi:AcrR family transcriptional regulator
MAKTPAPEPAPAEPAATDLRRHRSVTTRKKIADALLALVGEGVVRPTAEQVAQRADVGLRTVFRHFEDMETLYREVIRDVDAMILPVVHRHPGARSWKQGLAESIDVLAGHYERMAATYLVTQVHRHGSPFLDEQLRRYAELQRQMLRTLLPRAVLADRACVDALGLLMSIDAWVHLRREQGLSAAAAAKALHRSAQALVDIFDDGPAPATA